MRLTIIGCSGSFPGPDSPASCYLVEAEGFRLLIDLGSGALSALQRYAGLYDIDAICVSHLHADHCLDLCCYSVALTYHPEGPRPKIPVYGPSQAAVRLGYTNVYAPVTGTVSVRAARQGEVVNLGAPIVTIVDLTDTWVRAAIPETYADHIGYGDVMRVRLPGGTITSGKVFFKGVEGDFATQRDVSRRKRDIKTIVLKVRLDNPKGAFVPGMTAEVLVSPAQMRGESNAQSATAAGQP